MSNKKGTFIVFEGGEFVGKTTQITILARRLRDKGFSVVVTKEPGGTKEGEQIKEKIFAGGLSYKEELRLFMEDRKLHIDQVIAPALQKGAIVISDRFADSTIAYQHYGRGFSRERIDKENIKATRGIIPDLVILIDMDPAVAFLRAEKRGEALTTYEQEDEVFHRCVRKGFLDIARAYSSRYTIIRGGQQLENVSKDIWNVVRKQLHLSD